MRKNTDKKIKFEKGEIKKQISIAFTKDEIEFMKYAYVKTHSSSVAAYVRKLIHEEMEYLNWGKG